MLSGCPFVKVDPDVIARPTPHCWTDRETVGNSDGSVDTVDGWETAGNSLGRAPLGSETEVDIVRGRMGNRGK